MDFCDAGGLNWFVDALNSMPGLSDDMLVQNSEWGIEAMAPLVMRHIRSKRLLPALRFKKDVLRVGRVDPGVCNELLEAAEPDQDFKAYGLARKEGLWAAEPDQELRAALDSLAGSASEVLWAAESDQKLMAAVDSLAESPVVQEAFFCHFAGEASLGAFTPEAKGSAFPHAPVFESNDSVQSGGPLRGHVLQQPARANRRERVAEQTAVSSDRVHDGGTLRGRVLKQPASANRRERVAEQTAEAMCHWLDKQFKVE